ncbi:hypothetical protein [Azospirillum sp.]|uniref:hypothetical protein n=1 Tax=Azospirillum sp. TaxID=34012 RepID=UPI002D59DE0F|nr:hypothetical protein [Azospirillum sp.]HYD68496.1 hypothetical protein [Azospirillum sp.]
MTFDNRYTNLFDLAQDWALQSGDEIGVVIERILHWAAIGWFYGKNGSGLVDEQYAPTDRHLLPEFVRKAKGTQIDSHNNIPEKFIAFSRKNLISHEAVKDFCVKKRILPPSIIDEKWVHLSDYFPLGKAELAPPPCPYELPRYWTLGQALAWIIYLDTGSIPDDPDACDSTLRHLWRAGLENGACARAFTEIKENVWQFPSDTSGIFLEEGAAASMRLPITAIQWKQSTLQQDGTSLSIDPNIHCISVLISSADVKLTWPASPTAHSRHVKPPVAVSGAVGHRLPEGEAVERREARPQRGKTAEAWAWFEANITSYPYNGETLKKDWYGKCASSLGIGQKTVEVYFKRWSDKRR